MDKPLIIIGGPTASGKTKIGHELAKILKTEIISVDSMSVYKHMNIGTAKPPKEYLSEIRYHMIDIVEPTEYFDSFLYVEKVKPIIKALQEKNKIPILVGGTYLYIKALLFGFANTSDPDFKLREKLESIANKKGLDFLYQKLSIIDPFYAKKINKNDKKRIIRALEVFLQSFKPFSSFHSWDRPIFDYIGFYVEKDTKKLMEDIEKRVFYMIKNGLIEECKNLLSMGINERATSLQAIGYKEFISYLKGDISIEEAIFLVLKNTKDYAKRQKRWFRKNSFLPIKSVEEILNYINN